MAKPTGPLLSLGASGTIAETLTYSRWKGRPYIRQRVIPANPKTVEQQKTRNAFTWASDAWKNFPTLGRSPWDRFAQGQVLSGRNAFIGQNTAILRPAVVVDDWIGSPGAKGGLAPESILVTPGVGTLTVDFTNPTPPTGWTLDSAIATLLPAQDPQSETFKLGPTDEDAVTQSSIIFAGLDNAVIYTVSAWLQWSKPDTSIAYGASINANEQPT